MLYKHAAGLGGFLVVVLMLVGCDGNNMVEVTGTVTVDGKPVDEGKISFYPVDEKASPTVGGSIKDGQYSVKVPVTLMKVTINMSKVVGKKKLYDTPDSPERLVYGEVLPGKYSDRFETELQFEVKPGLNKKDWELKSN